MIRTDRYATIPPRVLPPWESVVAERRRETYAQDVHAAYRGARLLAQAERLVRRG